MKIAHTLLLVIATLSACSEPPADKTMTTALPPLATLVIEPSRVSVEDKFDGVIEAINQATVSAQTSGRVVELPVDVGDFVKKGDLIARFTDTEQKARAASAKARLDETRVQFERMKDMLARKLIAKADYDKAESAFKTAEAALVEADAGVAHTTIYAPYSGIVVSRLIKIGETIAPGTPIMTGLSLESLRAQVDIPQENIGAIRKFKTAHVLLANGSVLETMDIRIPPAADAQSHTFRVLVNLPNGDHNLFPGTLIKIAFVTGESERLLVPADSVAFRGEIAGVYVAANNTLELRMVNLGSLTTDNRYPVLAGLKSGETIVTDPLAATKAYKAARE